MPQELFQSLKEYGYDIQPADLGENITTHGIDLINLPLGTVLKIGATVELEVTGLRNPCSQIEDFKSGLLDKVLDKCARMGPLSFFFINSIKPPFSS